MNVYKINDYWITSENADQAFGVYMEETDGMSNCFIDEPEEGSTEVVSIEIKRLTKKAIEAKNMNCHSDFEDDCSLCRDKNDYVYVSLQGVINDLGEASFPCVIAKEE